MYSCFLIKLIKFAIYINFPMWATFVSKSSNKLFQSQHAIPFHKYLDNEAHEFSQVYKYAHL